MLISRLIVGAPGELLGFVAKRRIHSLATLGHEDKEAATKGAKAEYKRQEARHMPRSMSPVKANNFASLFRNSKLMQIGDPNGVVVFGQIIRVHNDDLYIDFGWKFNCVCKVPRRNSRQYVEGKAVKLRIIDLELSERFLGADKDLTLNEADASLLGLWSVPQK